jgi:tetratricopeptide (TPR) repeat protein
MTAENSEFHVPVPMTLDEQSGPAVRLSPERAEAMLAAALIEFDRIADGSAPSAPKPRPRLWSAWAMTGGALLAVAGSVAAARHYFHFGGSEPQPSAVSAPAQPTAAEPAPAALPPTASDAVAEEPAAVVEEPELAAKPERSGRAVRGAPEDLLQKANQLRASGQFRDAAQTYSLVYDRFPRSLAAYVARVAGAAIELEHLSNPTGARKLFEQALRDRPQGALDLEARQGLCVTLRDLEDRPAERRALSSLVAAHPDSPAARRAQVRLREIGAE